MNFQVTINGQVEGCDYPGADSLYCLVSYHMGQDWSQIAGPAQGTSQIGMRGGPDNRVVWNFPLQATFTSTNVFGWPQVVINVYGLDGIGRDVVRGYGAVHIPVMPGRHELRVRLFAPQPATPLQRFTGWLTASQAEFVDAKFAAKSSGRDVVRVASGGEVRVVVNVATHNLAAAGYDVGAGAPVVAAAASSSSAAATGTVPRPLPAIERGNLASGAVDAPRSSMS